MTTTLITGGTGYIGSAIIPLLTAAGHDVVAVVRSDEAAATVTRAGARAVVGDLRDSAWLAGLLADADGAIHVADLGPEGDDDVIAAVESAFTGSDRPFVYTGGVWTLGSGDELTETDAPNPPELTAWRVPREERVLASDYRGLVVSPGIVYGHGTGIVAGFLAGRADDGAVRLVGDGTQHWTTVHVDDLAALYVRVLESAPAHEHYLGVSGTNPTVREIAEAAGAGVVPESADESRERFGALFADALLLDQRATGAKARSLGWEPTRPSIIDDIRASVG